MKHDKIKCKHLPYSKLRIFLHKKNHGCLHHDFLICNRIHFFLFLYCIYGISSPFVVTVLSQPEHTHVVDVTYVSV